MQRSTLHATEWGADGPAEADWSSAVMKGVAGEVEGQKYSAAFFYYAVEDILGWGDLGS